MTITKIVIMMIVAVNAVSYGIDNINSNAVEGYKTALETHSANLAE